MSLSEADRGDIAEWARARARVAELVRAAGDAELGQRVPACPDWTCLDLVRHMTGVGASVLAGDEPDDHNPGWTQAHVDSRREATAEQVLDEWDGLADDLVAWMTANNTRPLNDVVIHEQDLRSALGRPGARDTDGFAIVRDTMAARLASAVADLPPLSLESLDGWRWRSHEDDGDETLLRADGFDLGRALTSRRTAHQLRSWVVRGDVDPYLGAFSALGALPLEPLPE